MSEDLSCQDDCRWDTLITHTKGVWLVILAFKVYFIAYVLHEGTVLTLGISRM